jgi:hypothetical protein
MVNGFDSILLRNEAPQRSVFATLLLPTCACLVLAFNAAGQLHLGFRGLIGLSALFLVLGTVGCYWYIASINLLGHWFRQTRPSELPNAEYYYSSLTILEGLWPIILLGPALSAQRWWPSFGAFMTLCTILGSGLTLMAAIRRVHNIHWIQAGLCLFLTVVLGSLAIAGLLGWPMMFILGTKNLSIVISA